MKPKRNREAYNEYIRTYLRKRYAERRALGLQMLGGKCVKCGASTDLEFDHIDPRTKLFDIADRMAQYPWEVVRDEIMKCQLLCESCHGKKSADEHGLSGSSSRLIRERGKIIGHRDEVEEG